MSKITNLKFCQAYKGQSVIFTTDGSIDLFSLQLGSIYQNADGKLAKIVSIDYYGNSFKLSPLMPTERFDQPDSGYNGVYPEGASIQLVIPS